jgi:hypothetical protein
MGDYWRSGHFVQTPRLYYLYLNVSAKMVPFSRDTNWHNQFGG